MRRFLVILALLAASACSSSASSGDTPEQISNYCKAYDETSPAIAKLLTSDPSGLSMAEGEKILEDFYAAYARRLREAPPSLKDSWTVVSQEAIDDSDLAERPLSVQQSHREAVAKINAFATQQCKLPGDIK